MTCNTIQLLEKAPTNSSSPYFQDRLQGIYNGILNQPGINFSEFKTTGLETNDKKIEFCLAALTMRFRQQREILKTTVGFDAKQIGGTHSLMIDERIRVEGTSWCEVIDFQALNIANSVAEFSEHSLPGSIKELYLPVLASGKRNEGMRIYSGMWTHLGPYAEELNKKTGQAGYSYVPELTTDLTPHFESLPADNKAELGLLLAQLSLTSMYGSLQGTAEQPIGVILKLQQGSDLPFEG